MDDQQQSVGKGKSVTVTVDQQIYLVDGDYHENNKQ
jgi:hypothetical protein